VTIGSITAAALATLAPLPYARNTYMKSPAGALPDAYLVYQEISDVPEQHADNQETSRTYRVQVSYYDRSGLESVPDINGAMRAAGFTLGPGRELPRDQETGHFGVARDYFYLMEA
jgi:hypothetical protein